MRKLCDVLLLLLSYGLSIVSYYVFSYCYQVRTYKGEGYANIKHLAAEDDALYLMFFILFSLITTIILYFIFKRFQKGVVTFFIHISVVLLLNYVICLIIPVISFFYDDWNTLVFSIWNSPVFVFNMIATVVVTMVCYGMDAVLHRFPMSASRCDHRK